MTDFGGRVFQFLDNKTALWAYVITVILSSVTTSIVWGCFYPAMENLSSTALGAMGTSMASVTLLTGLFPLYCLGRCFGRAEPSAVIIICILIIVYLVIEYTGFIVPLLVHGVTACLLMVEINNTVNSPTEVQEARGEETNKAAIIAGAVFAVLSTLAVAILAMLWCRITCDNCAHFSKRESDERRDWEREQEEEEEFYFNTPSYSVFPSTSIR